MYKKLGNLLEMLQFPSESDLESFKIAILTARRVDQQATLIYTTMSMHLANAKQDLVTAKVEFRVSYKALMADPEFAYVKGSNKKQIFECMLVEEQRKLDFAQELVERIKAYLQCVDRVLANVKHTREDISRKLKVLDVQREIQEV